MWLIFTALSGGRAALASVPEEDDELEDGEIADDAPEYDESAVDVARALMELASSGAIYNITLRSKLLF